MIQTGARANGDEIERPPKAFRNPVRSLRTFWINRKPSIIGLICLAASIALLWSFRDHLSGLASILWPIIVGASIAAFRSELRDLLRRVRRFGKDGVELGEEQIAAQIIARPVSEVLKEIAPNEEHSTLIMGRIESLRVELNSREPTDAARREYLLMLRLAESQQIRDFQSVWMYIFASQLEALTKMASELGAVDIVEYFEKHQERVKNMGEQPAVTISFEGWSGFFGRMHLALVRDTTATITDRGKEFLIFSTQSNLPRFQGL